MTLRSQIETRLAAAEARCEELRAVLELLDETDAPPGVGSPDPGDAEPDPPRPTRAPKAASGKWPEKIRDALSAAPLTLGALGDRLGVTGAALAPTLKTHPWFERVDASNRLSPWKLTDAGLRGKGMTDPAGAEDD